MKAFRDFYLFIIYSNFFIGVCSTMLAAETFVLLHLPSSVYWYLLMLAAGTVFIYALHYFVKVRTARDDNRLVWSRDFLYFLLLLALGCGVVIGIATIWNFRKIFILHGGLNWGNLAWYIIIPVLALSYSHPLNPRKKKSLRQTGWVKLALLSFTWSFTTTILPVLMLSKPHPVAVYPLLVLFIHRLVFMASLCVLFNIRDYEEDKIDGIKTIVVLLGPEIVLKKGKWLTLLLNTVCTIWLITAYHFYSPLYYAALGIPVILIFLGFHYFRRFEEEADFVVRYDGMMIVKALLLIFALLIQHH